MLRHETATVARDNINLILSIIQNIEDLAMYDDQDYLDSNILDMPEFYNAKEYLETIKERLTEEI